MACWPSAFLLTSILALSSLLTSGSAFYLPGVAPTSYIEGDLVPLHANRLTPKSYDEDPTVRSAVSYDYYFPAFGFCAPEGGPVDVGHESLGAVLFGDRIKTSPYELHMLQNETCKRLCDTTTLDAASGQFVIEKIQENYVVNWLVDGLPAGQAYTMGGDDEVFYTRGFPLGEHSGTDETGDGEELTELNNHYDILVYYHEYAREKYRVVGVLVNPSSRANNRNLDATTADCGIEGSPLALNGASDSQVTWTYSVEWRSSPIAWAVRWDTYLRVEDPKIHWFALINSSVIVAFFVGTVSAILTRALKKDFARYNRLADAFNLDDFSNGNDGNGEDWMQDDSGWKLVHGDVFRPPLSPLLLSVLLGNGAQLFFMTGVTIIFAMFGFLSPSNRGSLATAGLLLYTLFAFVGGYVSSRMYKTFGGEAWKRNIVMTPVFVPFIVFVTFFSLNLFLWARSSSGAVPFSTMIVLIGIWFLISGPLSFAGSWVGFRSPVSIPNLARTSPVPLKFADISAGLRITRSYKSDPPPDPTQHILPTPYSQHVLRRVLALWRHPRRAILHS